MVLAGLTSLKKGPLAQNMLSDLEDQHSWTALALEVGKSPTEVIRRT
jgi:hypothetical protein